MNTLLANKLINGGLIICIHHSIAIGNTNKGDFFEKSAYNN